MEMSYSYNLATFILEGKKWKEKLITKIKEDHININK